LWSKLSQVDTPIMAIIPNKDAVTFISKIKLFIEENLKKQTKIKSFIH